MKFRIKVVQSEGKEKFYPQCKVCWYNSWKNLNHVLEYSDSRRWQLLHQGVGLSTRELAVDVVISYKKHLEYILKITKYEKL